MTGRVTLPEPAPTFRLAVLQTAPALRDVPTNTAALAAAARSTGADLVLTPELSLTGYDIGDAVHELAIRAEPGTRPPELSAFADLPGQVVLGLIEAGSGGPFNAGVVLSQGSVVFRHRKVYLPTYGMFDEARWFGRGSTLEVWRPAHGWTAGLLICEDLWHPGLAYVLAARGIDVLLVQSAAPGREVWEGGRHGPFGSADVWERLACTAAQQYGIYVGLANRVGVEGGVTFAGGSLVAAPDGTIAARLPAADEAVIAIELSRTTLDAARRPFSHARDDDPRLVLRELARGLDG
ncbi:MAG: nitrilase-related carbon-nitrogen hydrolase [Gemmatimonadota bacterium]